MLERLKKWFRGVLGWMMNLSLIEQAEQTAIAVSAPMNRAIGLWMDMYMGNAPWLSDSVAGMNLAASIASEVSRMATIEMKSVVGGSARADYLDAQYRRIVDDARSFTEYAAAGGSIALKPYVDGGQIIVDYVRAGMFLPTAFSASGEVSGCIFLDRMTKGEAVYTRMEHHRMVPEGCRVTNKAYRNTTGSDGLGEPVELAAVDEWADIEPETTFTKVTRPLFAILKMPFANTIDPQSPMGISAYARAVELIEEADKQFSRVLWEMESGQRALYVDIRAFRDDEAEPGALPFKRFYRTMDGGVENDSLYQEWSPTLREQNQINALNEIMQRIEDACGLSRGTLSDAPESSAGGAKTATELKIMRQRTYATVRDVQKAVETALRQLLWAMDVLATAYDLAPLGEYEVSFEFDDSVVSDRGTEFVERSQLVQLGVMEPWELRMWYLGETEANARARTGAPPAEDDGIPEV